MSLPPLPTHGCDALTVQELHETLGLTRDTVRQALRVRNPEFVWMCSGEDPAQLDRVRAWYINEITMRGGVESCRKANAIRDLLKRKRRWHMVSWKSFARMLDVGVETLNAVSQGKERDIATYLKVAESMKHLPTLHPRSRLDGARVSSSKTALDVLTMRGRSIRRRRLAGYLSSAFVADQCGLTKEQLCEVEMGKASETMVNQVDGLLARMLGEKLETN